MSETSPAIPAIAEGDYPAVYLAADRTSRLAQKRHLWFTGMILGALVACAALGTLSAVFPVYGKVLALCSTAWAAASFMLTSMRKALKPEKNWYRGRAVAESAKSVAWRYMTGADPYPVSLPPQEADGRFIADLKVLATDQAQALGFGAEFSDRPQITARMREARTLPLEQRRQLYVKDRIEDQRRWYGDKARKSQAVANRYFVLIQASQALALAGTVLLFSAAISRWNVSGVFSALASALIAWLQVRQHEELSQTYAVAALDLGFIEEQAPRIDTEKDLSSFVNDAENSVSREHNLWIMRHTG
jgi:SMODS and SLOG-associating 2TM effector domain 3/SMODS and SLOG-associating 2TM effector domain 1